jgi:hypothetical protein
MARKERAIMSFLTALDEEIRSLHESLDNDPRFIKLRELEHVRALYNGNPVSPTESLPVMQSYVPDSERLSGAIGMGMLAARGRRISHERQAAINEVREFLLGKTEPTKTADLYDHLKSKGIKIGGSDPLNNLSALLSMSSVFQANGRSGWTLKTNEAAGSPSESGPAASKPALESAH